MDKVMVLQFIRGRKRLQIILLPWEGKYNICALIRFKDHHMNDATTGWRYFPAHGVPITLGLNQTERFVVDAGAEELLQSAWVNNSDGLEVRTYFDIDAPEATDLRMDRIPKSIFKRLSEEVDNWA